MQRYGLRLFLLLACLAPFVRLGMGEIQPWDESLYAIRADACLQFGAWLDQTHYAAGHLYSATHPPFGVWLIAASKFLFGDSTFAVRFPMALAACAAVVLLWLLVRRLAYEEAATIAAVSFATADLFLVYSHRGQMESLILCLGIGSIYALWSATTYERWRMVVLSGILLGLGLLTKFALVLFVAPILVLLPWMVGKPRLVVYPLITVAVGLLIAAPWFAMMTAAHPDYWSHVGESFSTLAAGTYKPSHLSWWYYVNRLIVGLPLIVIILFSRRAIIHDKRIVGVALWLIAVFITLQVVGTRMPHFATLLFMPGALLVGLLWSERSAAGGRMKWIGYTTISILVLWSASEQLRLFVTGRLAMSSIVVKPAALIAVAVFAGLCAILWRRSASDRRLAIVFLAFMLAIAYAHLLSADAAVYHNGARDVAELAAQLPGRSRMVVIHPDYPHEEYAPQLAYYTKGWTLGWLKGRDATNFAIDSAIRTYQPDARREVAVVVRDVDRFNPPQPSLEVQGEIDRKLGTAFPSKKEFRSYVLYY